MANAIEFTQALIESTEHRQKFARKLHESSRPTPAQMKFHKMEKCGSRKVKGLTEASDNEAEVVKPAEEVEKIDTTEDKVATTEETADEIVTTDVEEGAEDIEESIDDLVFFCNKCHKHFIATPEVAVDTISCPICEDDTMLINMGKASDYLEDTRNEDAAEVIREEEPEVFTEEPEQTQEQVNEIELDAEGLGESLSAVARKHINEKASVKVLAATRTDSGDVLAECVCLPVNKKFTVTLKGATKITESKGVIECQSNMLKNCKLRVGYITEGKKMVINRMGYGFLSESTKAKPHKVVGVVGK